MAFLDVVKLNKSFNGKKIIKDISFELEKGKALSIIGSSGSGKTTLLRCLNFLEFADEGEIFLDNKLIYEGNKTYSENELVSLRKHFGLVFQQFNLFPQYTALENVMLAQKLKGNNSKDKALMLLDQMGLSDRIDYYPHQLSGGQQQRVAIARALCLDPDILCFDEPTSALDPQLTSEVLKVIKQLSDKKTTMIIVTHEIAFARKVSDKVIFMSDGRIVESGTPEEVIDNPKNELTIHFLSNIITNWN